MKILRVLAIGVTVGGLALAMNTEKAEAAEWTPRTVDQIKADIAKTQGNKYTIVWGDTMWGISQATNLTVQKLADLNKIANVDLIYAGNTLVFDGNVVTAKNDKGETVAQSVVTPQDKNDANKPVGKQEPAKQAEEKAQGTTANSGKTAISSQEMNGAVSDTNSSQTVTSGSVEGATSSTAGTTVSPGIVETPAQPSKPADNQPTQSDQSVEKPTTPTQPSTSGEQGGSTTI
ncbi:LysM peptidoglycan-binding domain-containing protein [Enterococcus faecalis]|uniref:LysM peptidoglycan-binding domain-containing protein n=1 Tax=Enterococcus faecalis TaxID=1351 RepID=UPI001E294625|nr:LysM peptidoglycan-binding domain-containing protein [Enterococcus faecalis]